MKWRHEIEERLSDPSSRVLCLDPTGGSTKPLHHVLALFAGQALEAAGPLDLFTPEERGKIVKAFAIARVRGIASVEVPINTGEIKRFDLFNEEADLGCYVVIMGPPAETELAKSTDTAQLTSRATTYNLDMAGNILWAHPEIDQMLGWHASELVGQPVLNFTHPDDHEDGIVGWIKLLDQGLGARLRNRRRFLAKDGTWRYVEGTSTNLLDDPARGYISSELIDVSDEIAALEEAKRRDALLTRLTEALPTGVLHIGPERLPIFWNQRWMELLGHASPSIEGLLEQLQEREEVSEAIGRSLDTGADADIDVTILDGSELRYGRLHLRPLEHADGPAEVLITLEDTTTARELQQDLHELAHRDALTGLLGNLGSRALVEDQLLDADGTRALLFVDLDAFKLINDTHGHATGDEVLRAVGRGITSAVRRHDAVARIGGDEFIVAVRDVSSMGEIEEIIARIHVALRASERSIDRAVEIRASIGMAEVQPGDTFDTLLRRADQAMYRVKRAKQAIRPPSLESPDLTPPKQLP